MNIIKRRWDERYALRSIQNEGIPYSSISNQNSIDYRSIWTLNYNMQYCSSTILLHKKIHHVKQLFCEGILDDEPKRFNLLSTSSDGD